MLTLKELRHHFRRSTQLLVIGVAKEDFKMKSMPCSFVLALLCVHFEELAQSKLTRQHFISDLMDIFGAVGTVEQ
eukprot:737903-Pelagomonas_calceolata.AAC.1